MNLSSAHSHQFCQLEKTQLSIYMMMAKTTNHHLGHVDG